MQARGLAPPLPFCERLLQIFEQQSAQYGVEAALAPFIQHSTTLMRAAVRPYVDRAAACALPELYLWTLQLYALRLRDSVVQPSAGRILQRTSLTEWQQAQHPVVVVDPFDASFNCGKTVTVIIVCLFSVWIWCILTVA